MRQLFQDVAAGKVSLREAAKTPVFDGAVASQMTRYSQDYRNLSEEDRENLARRGRQKLVDESAEQSSAPAKQQPDDGGDDEDFSDRSWLV
ncbi:hypothetical protein D5S17_27320 [Pseudonocardiaceae bacterium YIM PH 21723]|nr:hypothetical protein D5S17_27320 [Pseudonocardiaceae bacterium YIM PH 21723]